MKLRTNRIPMRADRRPGFTLVEMLVSVALILLMMTMFASIFSMATDSVSKQRGISENDQKARSLTTVIRSDFQHRTMRYPLAFYPGEDSSTSPTPFGSRAGYLYISTNNPNSGLDDLIQFTVDANILIENADDTPFFGRATQLRDLTNNSLYSSATDPNRSNIGLHPNQPEADDGNLQPNGTGSSTAAEVCYFLRYGNLYRRVSLLRKPLPIAGRELDVQPRSSLGYDLLSAVDGSGSYDSPLGRYTHANGNGSNNFLRDFDYSAVATGIGGNQSTSLIGIGSLSNELTSAGATSQALGNPVWRFGFNQLTGFSREHTGVGGKFIGRFTQGETSAVNFNWPQSLARVENVTEDAGAILWSGNPVPGNPLDIRNVVSLNTGNGVISEFDEAVTGEGRGGSRAVEDLLLPNVHEMKVEIWDQRLQRFVVPGHSSTNPATGEAGDYHVLRNLNSAYGPQSSASGGAVFDTWYANVTADFDGSGLPASQSERSPPYIAYEYYPPLQNAAAPGPSPVAMPGPMRTYWVSGQYSVGDIVFAPVVFDGDAPNEIFEWGPGGDVIPSQAFHIAYRCIGVNNLDGDGTTGETGASVPGFPGVPGRLVTDNEVTWESFDNRRPLQSVRLTIRFMDQTTDTMRQLSLILPLTDKGK